MFFWVRRFIFRRTFEPGRHIWGPTGKTIDRIFPENGDFQHPPREALCRESSREWRYGNSIVADRKPLRFGLKELSILFGRTTKIEVSLLRLKIFIIFSSCWAPNSISLYFLNKRIVVRSYCEHTDWWPHTFSTMRVVITLECAFESWRLGLSNARLTLTNGDFLTNLSDIQNSTKKTTICSRSAFFCVLTCFALFLDVTEICEEITVGQC